MRETVPLALIQECVLEFLRDRDDAAVFGAQAVNAYVDEPRMSQDVDILSLNAESLAESIRALLNEKFNIAMRVRSVANGAGFRVYQIRQPRNRHLVDVRQVSQLPSCERLERILVPLPSELISQKVISLTARSKTAKGMTDLADLRRLLLAFPNLKASNSSVLDALQVANAGEAVLAKWQEIADSEIELEDEDAGY
jgi:hypothetical protein